MKLLIFNDLHISDKAPLGRKDDYMTAVLIKLAEIIKLGLEHEVEAIVCSGDLFHIKRPNMVSHWLVGQIAILLQALENKCNFYVVPGNHDLGPDELSSLPRQPLGVLNQLGVVQVLTSPVEMSDGTLIIPKPYNYLRETDPTYYEIESNGNDRNIVVAHGPVLPTGDSRPYPYINIDDIPHLERVATFFCGHIHERLGLHKMFNGSPTQFCNFGSVGRTARTQANMLRKVSVALYNSEDNSIEEIPLKSVRPISEIFEEVERSTDEGVSDEVSRFAKVLAKGLHIEQVELSDLMASVKMDEPVKVIVQRLLEEQGL